MPQVFGRIGWRQARGAVDAPRPSEVDTTPSVADEGALVEKFVYVAVGLYAVTFAVLSVLQHLSFNTNAFDLGNMDQAVWNTMHGRPLEFTNWEGGNTRLAAHVEPILFLVALTYRIYSSPTTLLVLQSFVISLGALPAFWLAKDVLRNSFAAVVFSFSYLLSPALEIANLADFHAVAFSSSFLLFAFYYAYKHYYLGFFTMAVLAMATKEHVPFSVFLLGLYIIVIQRRPNIGLVTCGVSALWAATAFLVIIPHFNPEGVSPYLSRYDHVGAGPMEIVENLVSDPGGAIAMVTAPAKATYALSLFSPTLFLALLSPATAVMTLPDLSINLLSNFSEMYLGNHYGAVIVPFMTVSAILGAGTLLSLLRRVNARAAQWVMAALAVAVLVSSLQQYYFQVFLPLTDHLPHLTPHETVAQDIIKLIPPDAAVSAGSTLNPHVSQRRQLSLFPDLPTGQAGMAQAEYILVDVTATPFPIDKASQWWRLTQLLDSGQWGIVAARDGIILLRKGALAQTLPEEFYSFVQAAPKAAHKMTNIPFGQDVRMVGYRLEPAGALHGSTPYAGLTLFLQIDQTPRQDFYISVKVVKAENDVVFTDNYQATTLWYPPGKWRPGDLLQVEVPYLPLQDAEYGEVWVSFVDREQPDMPAEQLLPRPQNPADQENLRDGGASMRIAELKKG